ncbi:glycine zipper domain-containing protein [Rubripirellula sp.]|nr:glycine zipper domain-containing protein [Rubripirellula sp.]MDB4338910.1 glycine zipper domain-containing protein [Rubripirellula sp.]
MLIHLRTIAWVVAAFYTTLGQSQERAQRGATVGGLSGAIAGGIIGDHNGNAGAGAVIGGVVGAVTGGLIGDANDQAERRRNSRSGYIIANSPTHSISPSDVIEMVQAGISERLIINQINQRGVTQHPMVKQIIDLHQRGVSEDVIAAMQQAPLRSPTQPQSEVIHDHYQPRVITQPRRIAQPWIMNPNFLIPSCPPDYYRSRYYYRYPRSFGNFGIHLQF